jgi:hypothetical protein
LECAAQITIKKRTILIQVVTLITMVVVVVVMVMVRVAVQFVPWHVKVRHFIH